MLLMQKIQDEWGPIIAATCHASSVPEAFIAALIANETGGDPKATRFEPAVYARLKAKHPDWEDSKVRDNATSWGPTQIMGYNYPGPCRDLQGPAISLNHSLRMLSGFAEQYELDVTREFEEMFRCWNTGRPNGKTYDPQYVENGLRRMKVYESLLVPVTSP